MTVAYLGLGSNLGDRSAHLRKAIASLRGAVEVTALSSLYESEAVGPPGQGDYYNLVVEVETDATPLELLEICRRLEKEAGRVRGERWGARTLDVDLLLFGEEEIAQEELVVPHPRMWERPFVVQPLVEIAPHLAGRGQGASQSTGEPGSGEVSREGVAGGEPGSGEVSGEGVAGGEPGSGEVAGEGVAGGEPGSGEVSGEGVAGRAWRVGTLE